MLIAVLRNCYFKASRASALRIEREFYPDAMEIQETPPSPLPRMLLWTIAAFATTCVLWACFSIVDVVSTADGRVIPDGRVKVLQATDSAIVRSINVKEGSLVSKGQLLVELDPTITNAALESVDDRVTFTRLELTRLNAELKGVLPSYPPSRGYGNEISIQETLRGARNADYAAKIGEARNLRQSREMSRASANDAVNKLIAMTNSAAEKELRVRPHVGFVMSQFDYIKLIGLYTSSGRAFSIALWTKSTKKSFTFKHLK